MFSFKPGSVYVWAKAHGAWCARGDWRPGKIDTHCLQRLFPVCPGLGSGFFVYPRVRDHKSEFGLVIPIWGSGFPYCGYWAIKYCVFRLVGNGGRSFLTFFYLTGLTGFYRIFFSCPDGQITASGCLPFVLCRFFRCVALLLFTPKGCKLL